VDSLQGEQIPLGHHAAQATISDQADVRDVSAGHGDGRVKGAGVRAEMKRRLDHAALNWLAEVDIDIGHGFAQVTQG
nr:hypothetical protein [Tanacetum cinerariifolium]